MQKILIKGLKESDIDAAGGVVEADLYTRGINELVTLAAITSQRFKESLARGSIKPWIKGCREAACRLREANSETALGFLLRKGIQVTANDWYNTVPREWQNYCRVEGSSAVAEWYGPLYPSTIAGLVPRGTQFPEGQVIGEDSALVNQKFGLIEAFDRELFDDDQTGQIRDRSRNLGSSMGTTESVWAASRFIGSARTYANLTVPVSNYSTINQNGTAITSPFSTSLYGSSGNRPTTFAPLSANMLKVGLVVLMNAIDPLQNKIVVNPNTLLVSTQDAINADILLTPGGYPAVIGLGGNSIATANVLGGTTSAAGATQGVIPGQPGGWGSPNPFAAMGIKKVLERYLPDWAWAIGEKGKGLVFQERDALEITQEAPNTGQNFNFDGLRYRSRRRFECDWVGGGSRFWYEGDDGTVAGQQ